MNIRTLQRLIKQKKRVYNEAGNWIRRDANPDRGFPFLESAKGDSGDHNFITVVPGYTALDISFPDASDIEALFNSSRSNIGTGDRDYFIVDRTKIVQDQIRYEVQASQSSAAVASPPDLWKVRYSMPDWRDQKAGWCSQRSPSQSARADYHHR